MISPGGRPGDRVPPASRGGLQGRFVHDVLGKRILLGEMLGLDTLWDLPSGKRLHNYGKSPSYL